MKIIKTNNLLVTVFFFFLFSIFSLYPFSIARAQVTQNLQNDEIYFKNCLAQDPLNSDILFNLASVYEQMGATSKAIKFYHRVIHINASDTIALLRLGDLQRKSGELAEALITLKRCTNLAPHNSQVWYTLGNTHCDLGEYHKAILDLNNALKYLSKNESGHKSKLIYYKGVLYLAIRDYTNVKKCLQQLQKIDTNLHSALQSLYDNSH